MARSICQLGTIFYFLFVILFHFILFANNDIWKLREFYGFIDRTERIIVWKSQKNCFKSKIEI